MPNTILLPYTVSEDHTSFTVADTTVYSNPTRVNVGVFLSVKKVTFRGGELRVTTTPDSGDAALVSEWIVSYDLDGHYRFKYVAVPNYDVAVTYAKYAAVYDSVSGNVYVSVDNGNIGNAVGNTTYWTLVSDPTSLVDKEGTASESLNIDAAAINYVLSTLTADARDRKAIEAATECFGDYGLVKSVDDFTMLDVFTEGLIAADEASEFNKGESIARRAEALL